VCKAVNTSPVGAQVDLITLYHMLVSLPSAPP
jgi:hypothetical protein